MFYYEAGIRDELRQWAKREGYRANSFPLIDLSFQNPEFLTLIQSLKKSSEQVKLDKEMLQTLEQSGSEAALLLKDTQPLLGLFEKRLLVSEHQILMRQHEQLQQHEKYTKARLLLTHRLETLVHQHSQNLQVSEMPPLQKIRAYGVKALQALNLDVPTPGFMIDLTKNQTYIDVLERYFSEDPTAIQPEYTGALLMTEKNRTVAVCVGSTFARISSRFKT